MCVILALLVLSVGSLATETDYLSVENNEIRTEQEPVYTNQFAVRIEGGNQQADLIAQKYDFVNLGQIGTLDGYFLFEVKRLHKRSTEASHHHRNSIYSESGVSWVEQQTEKRRVKRGFNSKPQINSFFRDPMFQEQWYLNNGGTGGTDMNVHGAWSRGYTGKNVVVSILDDGIQTNHPDLAVNYDPQASYDINSDDGDPMPRNNGDNKHGTRCAGEVAAVAGNGYCGVGIAFNASIGGVRMLDGVVNDAVEARALSLNPQHIDIYSASWGPEDDGRTVDGPGPLARRAFINGVMRGREGKGSIFIWASGNGGRHTDSCNCDGYTNSIFTLSISSATQGGYKPWYLEECSSTLATTYSSGTPGHDKSVATTDMDGSLRPEYICTAEHTGTSASAPIAAGICALALEANPRLTWRDMQYLVVMTSRPGPLEKEMGWTINGVGRKVSHKFGYGLMDASAMVDLAANWRPVPPQHICQSTVDSNQRDIPREYGARLEVPMNTDGCQGTFNEVKYLEHVQCKVTLQYKPRGNLRILLTSPAGTTTVLLFERPRDIMSSSFDEWPFLSVHFWGEMAVGTWKLTIMNAGTRTVVSPGILKSWQLILYGSDSNPLTSQPTIPEPSPSIQQPVSVPRSFSPPFPQFHFPSSADSAFPNIFSLSGSNKVEYYTKLSNSQPSINDFMDKSQQKFDYSDCHEECLMGCYGPQIDQCKMCRNYRLNKSCVTSCPNNTYIDTTRNCQTCHSTCVSCSGAGQDKCTSCQPHLYYVADLSLCLAECPSGYLQDSTAKSCHACVPHCTQCTRHINNCTACSNNLVLHGNQCLASCPTDTFETEDYSCEPCHSSCLTCMGRDKTDCVSCAHNSSLLAGSCVESCPSGYYRNADMNECVKCMKGCMECNREGRCSKCDSHLVLDKYGGCMVDSETKCSDGQFYDGSHCMACHSTCSTCYDGTPDSCISCPIGYIKYQSRCVSSCGDGLYEKDKMCFPCAEMCELCTSEAHCQRCKMGTQLMNGMCLSQCKDGYYSDRGTCRACYMSCATCKGPGEASCVSCPTGWMLSSGQCHLKCPESQYDSKFGCQRCHHSCKSCTGEGLHDCTECHAGRTLSAGICIECQPRQYYNEDTGKCDACHEDCLFCNGAGEFNCISCPSPLIYDSVNKQCVRCCNNSTTGEKCCRCNELGQCEISGQKA